MTEPTPDPVRGAEALATDRAHVFHPPACASIVASIDAMKDEGVLENATRVGADVLGP